MKQVMETTAVYADLKNFKKKGVKSHDAWQNMVVSLMQQANTFMAKVSDDEPQWVLAGPMQFTGARVVQQFYRMNFIEDADEEEE